MAALLLKVIKDYKIGKKVGFFVTDNASSNDVAIDIVLRHLYPLMTKEQRQRRRLRCLGHIINLAAQVLILGNAAEKDLQDLSAYNFQGDFNSVAAAWRKKGVIGKVHNIVKYIRMTPQRRQEFGRCISMVERELKWNKHDVSFQDLAILPTKKGYLTNESAAITILSDLLAVFWGNLDDISVLTSSPAHTIQRHTLELILYVYMSLPQLPQPYRAILQLSRPSTPVPRRQQ